LIRGGRERNAARHLRHRRRAVERVGDEVLLFSEDVYPADDLTELIQDALREWHNRSDAKMFERSNEVKDSAASMRIS
jgi:hypothetical protein